MAVIGDLMPYKSVRTVTGWPARMRSSCTSLKFASTHTFSSGTTASSGVPAATLWPTCTERLATTPLSGEIKSVRCKASAALRTAAAAAKTCG